MTKEKIITTKEWFCSKILGMSWGSEADNE